MMRKRKKHTREFKISIIRELDAGKTLGEVAREYELHPTMIARWKTEYLQNPERAFSGNGHLYKEKARIAELERIVGQLYAENAFLKKTLAYLEARRQEERTREGLV